MERHLDALQLDQDSGQLSGQSSAKGIRKQGREGYPTLSLTVRDEEILVALVHRIRCINIKLASWSWPNGTNPTVSAKRRLKQLVRAGWLTEVKAYARPLIDLNEPVATWSLSEPVPEFGPISYHLKNRFMEPARSVAIFVATVQATKRFGGTAGRRPRSSEVTHDLGVASVFFKLKHESPERAARWISEAKIVARGNSPGVKVPDALVKERDGRSIAIEFGGEYSKQKLQAFHQYCQANELGYELW